VRQNFVWSNIPRQKQATASTASFSRLACGAPHLHWFAMTGEQQLAAGHSTLQWQAANCRRKTVKKHICFASPFDNGW
jgi:hypothetical protein